MAPESIPIDNQTLFACAVFCCQHDLGFPIVANLDSSKEFAARKDWQIFEYSKDLLFEGEDKIVYRSWDRIPGDEAQIMAERVKLGEVIGQVAESMIEALFLILLTRKEAQIGLSAEEKKRLETLQKNPSETTRSEFEAWLMEGLIPDDSVLLGAAFSRSLMIAALSVSEEFYRETMDQLAPASLFLLAFFRAL